MEFSIRKGVKKDMPAVYQLICELANFEDEPEAVEITADDLIADGFKEVPEFEVFVAQHNEQIVGIAVYYRRYSTWKGRSLHLEDLIVSKDFRGLGIGRALYRQVIKTAYDNGMNRLEWEVLDWNKNAIEFYQSSGAQMLDNWNICQMTKTSMKQFLDRNAGI